MFRAASRIWRRRRGPGHSHDGVRMRFSIFAAACLMAQAAIAGEASWYGGAFHGHRTACGERFDMNALTAAHRMLPCGTRVQVTDASTGASVVVRVNDRGPFARGREIDLSRAAAAHLPRLVRLGHISVKLKVLGG